MAKVAYSAMFNEISGKMGTDVLSRARCGPTSRVKVAPKNPKSDAQRQARGYLKTAAKSFKSMTQTQVDAWNAYAANVIRHNPVTGETYESTGINVYIEQVTKCLQVNPSGLMPLTPPASEFTGDSITLTCAASAGTLTITASAANASGVTTEILVQQLASPHRKPNPNGYRHKAFKAFATGALTQTISVASGYYAVAYRFVRTNTGQDTDLLTLPIQTVTLSVAADGANAKKKAA